VSAPVRLVLADVDGTLLTPDKTLTTGAIRAVERLGDAGIIFALTSARPPQGLMRFVEPLKLTTPLAAFNGGLVVDAHMKVLEKKTIRDDLVAPILDLLASHELSIWLFQGAEWFVTDEQGPHVRDESRVCDCGPTTRGDFGGLTSGVTKVVGVSDDPDSISAAAAAISAHVGSLVSATRSQSYFLDVTHPDANKGSVVRYLSSRYDVPTSEIATIGDMHNDVSMFAASGLSIAMGNAAEEVKSAAREVTRSNSDDGFEYAIETFVLTP
jgi:Cof subfamily protein (haloacid dehalogenase superfamily)